MKFEVEIDNEKVFDTKTGLDTIHWKVTLKRNGEFICETTDEDLGKAFADAHQMATHEVAEDLAARVGAFFEEFDTMRRRLATLEKKK